MNDPLAEAVEQARSDIEWRLESLYAEAGRGAVAEFEAAIRAQERARYQALVDAAQATTAHHAAGCNLWRSYRTHHECTCAAANLRSILDGIKAAQ